VSAVAAEHTSSGTRPGLAEDIAAFLAEHPSASTRAVALGVHGRKEAVIDVLAEDERFVEVAPAPPLPSNARCWTLANGDREHDGTRLRGDAGLQTADGSSSANGAAESLLDDDEWFLENPADTPRHCEAPELHRSARAWFVSSSGPRCIACEDPLPPLTLREFMTGLGGEHRRNAFLERWRSELDAASPQRRAALLAAWSRVAWQVTEAEIATNDHTDEGENDGP
jgi:hypothetical protein